MSESVESFQWGTQKTGKSEENVWSNMSVNASQVQNHHLKLDQGQPGLLHSSVILVLITTLDANGIDTCTKQWVQASPSSWVGYSANVTNGKSFQVYMVYFMVYWFFYFKDKPKNEISMQINRRKTMVNTLLIGIFK